MIEEVTPLRTFLSYITVLLKIHSRIRSDGEFMKLNLGLCKGARSAIPIL
jgi:hypothetical protein